MNLQNIFNQIEKSDPEVYERLNGRREVIRNFTRFAGKVSVAAVPIALGTILQKAYGQTPTNAIDILNFALKLEYLEAAFYEKGLATPDLIDADADKAALTIIGGHETAHVNYIKAAISAAGGTPVDPPEFDFTAAGAFPDVFTNYDTFLAVAQTFEDTGVRAYKGQAGSLMVSNEVLLAALSIHSVEARHASHIRQMRKGRGAGVKPWITGSDSGIGAAVQASYDGEEATTQAGVAITNISNSGISESAASEAFDEPLTFDEVIAIVTPFFAV